MLITITDDVTMQALRPTERYHIAQIYFPRDVTKQIDQALF